MRRAIREILKKHGEANANLQSDACLDQITEELMNTISKKSWEYIELMMHSIPVENSPLAKYTRKADE